MDERRKFFRIKNKGEIIATSSNELLDVLEISSTGLLIIKKNPHIEEKGVLEIKIHNYTLQVDYEILRSEANTMVLVFKKEEQINKLFTVLKHLRDEQNKDQEMDSTSKE